MRKGILVWNADKSGVSQALRRRIMQAWVGDARLSIHSLGIFGGGLSGRSKRGRGGCRGLEARRPRRRGHFLGSSSSACLRSVASVLVAARGFSSG